MTCYEYQRSLGFLQLSDWLYYKLLIMIVDVLIDYFWIILSSNHQEH